MMNEKTIAMEELTLNIKKQIGTVKEPTYVGYKFDEIEFVFMVILPKRFLK